MLWGQYQADRRTGGQAVGRLCKRGPQCGLRLRWALSRIAEQQTSQGSRKGQGKGLTGRGYPALDSGIIQGRAKLITGFTVYGECQANSHVLCACIDALLRQPTPPASPSPTPLPNWPQHRGQNGTRPGRTPRRMRRPRRRRRP